MAQSCSGHLTLGPVSGSRRSSGGCGCRRLIIVPAEIRMISQFPAVVDCQRMFFIFAAVSEGHAITTPVQCRTGDVAIEDSECLPHTWD